MAVPEWVARPGISQEKASVRGRSLATFGSLSDGGSVGRFSDSRSSSGRVRSTSERTRLGLNRSTQAKLGKTTGVAAVVAWSARMEIAHMIEAGVPAKDILEVIKNGEESDTPLMDHTASKGSSTPGKQTRRKRSIEVALDPPGRFSRPRSSGRSRELASDGPLVDQGGNKDPSAPSWTGSPLATMEFSKKAMPPGVESEGYVPTTPEGKGSGSQSGESDPELGADEMLDDGFFFKDSKKRAIPPPKGRPSLVKEQAQVQKTLPNRTNPVESERLADFRSRCKSLFEDLVILGVKMDIIASVIHTAGAELDLEMFYTLTDPRSPGTGLRYARLLKSHLDAYEAVPEGEKPKEVFGIQFVQSRILELMKSSSGFRTPQSLIYAIEHFSVIFGFTAHGAKHPRCRKLANDYTKQAPERTGAPTFGVSFLDYLEKTTMDELKDIETRVACGKLRLCTQASVRHSDLAGTSMEAIEWCRVVGATEFLGLRARARKTKSGPRPWAASWLGVCPENDNWLMTLMRLVLEMHGPTWKQHGFFGCSSDGKGHYRHSPPGIEEDVTVVKRSLMLDLEAGRVIPLTREEISSLRWHSCKSTMPTLMTHYGIQTRTIRLQGAWKKKSEAMTDLYLREAQTIVLKAQIQVLDQIRRGVAIQVLEGKSLDEMPRKPNWASAAEFAERGLGSSHSPVSRDAMAELKKAVACYKNEAGQVKIRAKVAAAAKDLPVEFLGGSPQSPEQVVELAESECELLNDVEQFNEEMVKDTALQEDVETESEDSDANPVVKDMELYANFVIKTHGNGKVHKPNHAVFPDPTKPWCGTAGDDWADLVLNEHWGAYSLCSKCFGKDTGCGRLCSYQVKKGGVALRCGRRCQPQSNNNHDEDAEDGNVEGPHFCALHAAELELREDE